MKITRIGYARTYNQNYQSYRASADAEIEEWETDIDASYDRLREIVRQQIGKQCEDYNGADSDEVLVLREAIEELRKDRSKCYELIRELEKQIKEKQSLNNQLTSSLEVGNSIIGETIHTEVLIVKKKVEYFSQNLLFQFAN